MIYAVFLYVQSNRLFQYRAYFSHKTHHRKKVYGETYQMNCVNQRSVHHPPDLRIIRMKSGFVFQHMGLTADRSVTQCKSDPSTK